MIMTYPTFHQRHFFNPQTRTSLELPLGWAEEETGERFVIYTSPLAGEPAAPEPKLVIKVVTTAAGQPHAYRELAQQVLALSQQDFHLLAHQELSVDGFPGVADLFTYYEAQLECPVVQYQAFVQIDTIIFSITGIAAATQQAQYIPVFETALQSVRFIPAE